MRFKGVKEEYYQTQNVHPMLGYRWPTVIDAGPTLTNHWVNVSCLMGYNCQFPANTRR